MEPQDPKERLARTIAALEAGQFSQGAQNAQEVSSKPAQRYKQTAGRANSVRSRLDMASGAQLTFTTVPQAVPWGLAYALAVQKESVGAGRAVRGLGPRPKHGQHPGPSTLLKHRTGALAAGEGAAPAFDPFGRTTTLLTNPVEASWRSTIAATVPEPPPIAQAPGVQPQPSHTGSGGGAGAAASPRSSRPLAPAGAEGAVHGGGGSPLRHTGVGKPTGVKQGDFVQAVAANMGWGGNPMRLAEVPEAFWQTVSPEVHSNINEYLFEQVRLGSQGGPMTA